MIGLIIGLIALLLAIGIGLWVFFNNRKTTEEVDNAHEIIGASKDNDKNREELIKKSKEQIEKNKKILEENKKVLNANKKTTGGNS
jgi:uncharacterized protein HemX